MIGQGQHEGELKLTEERLARVSVLQELTVAALDLFDPRRSMDEFLERVAMRLGCLAALCLCEEPTGLRLLGASGLARTSRALALPTPPPDGDGASIVLPYPELAREGLVRWYFRISVQGESRSSGVGCFLLLFFEGESRVPAPYHGVIQRLTDILRSALLHRRLYARTIESERNLYEQKSLLECLSEASIDAILFADLNGRVTCNHRFSQVFGHAEGASPSAREVIRKAAASIAEPAGMALRIERLLASPDEQVRCLLKLQDGRYFDLASVSIRSPEGVHYGRAFYFRDVSETKRAEEERTKLLAQEQAARAQAEEAQRRSAFLAEASALLAVSLDYHATLGQVARITVPEFADWCLIDVLDEQDCPRRVALVHADPGKADVVRELCENFPANPNWTAGLGRLLKHGKPELYPAVNDEELRLLAQNDRNLLLLRDLGIRSALLAPLVARGRKVGAITLVYGASGRRYAEADRGLVEDLACRVALAVDNARLYEHAQAAVRARDEFLSIASHELRTPVTSLHLAVQGLLHLAETGGLAQSPANFVSSSLQAAFRQSSRLGQLIDKLLDVSRIQAGRLELMLEEVDLAALVREVASAFREEIARARCELILAADQPVVGRWDRERLEQVVANLLSNAIKYAAQKPIELRVERDGDRARLTVRDRGIGIPLQRQEAIFERFERAVSSRHYSGFGLGLYIVKRILEAFEGTVRVQSQLGEGATFIVELPLAGPARHGSADDAADHQGAA